MARKDDDHAGAGGFSFDRDPGALQESGEMNFTFSDIPVLGQDAKLKEKFSLDPRPETGAARAAEDAALASFEQMLREQPRVSEGEDGEGQTDVSHGINQGFLAEQRHRWQNKVRQAARQRGLAISAKLAYVLIPLIVLAGLIYLATSLWFQYQAEEEAKKNYVAKPKRPLLDRREAEEARKLKEAMELDLARADQAAADGNHAEAVAIYQDLATRQFFKPGFLQPRLGRCLAQLGEAEAAMTAYREALAATPTEAAVFVAAATLFNRQKLYTEAMATLKAGLGAFPDDMSLHAMLAETSFVQGDTTQALASFKALKRGDMTERQLDIYGRLLNATGQRGEARKVFFFSAKRYNGFAAYLAAAEVSDKPRERIEIMAHASGALVDAREVNSALALLAKYLLEDGKAEEAKKQLTLVNPALVGSGQILGLVETCLALQLPEDQFKGIVEKIIRQGFAEDVKIQVEVQDLLVRAKLESLMLSLYGEWWALSPGNAMANYFYGRALKTGPSAIERFAKAVELMPTLVEAWQDLAAAYYAAKKWQQAKETYVVCVRLRPNDPVNHHRLALVHLYGGQGATAIEEYAAYLRGTGTPEAEQIRLLLDLAMRLPTSDLAEKYLVRLRQLPGTDVECRTIELRIKLYFNRLTDADFADVVPKAARETHQLYLLGKGKIRDVLMMPTPPEEFPEFWKVFLCRLSNIEWQDNAERLVERHRNSLDPTIPILGNVWLGRIAPDEARAMNERIPPGQEPLFYFILAEEYRRLNNPVAAKICYTRALAGRPNPMTKVVEHFNRPRRGF